MMKLSRLWWMYERSAHYQYLLQHSVATFRSELQVDTVVYTGLRGQFPYVVALGDYPKPANLLSMWLRRHSSLDPRPSDL